MVSIGGSNEEARWEDMVHLRVTVHGLEIVDCAFHFGELLRRV